MQTLTYNRQVFMPDEIKKLGNVPIKLVPTRHALKAAATERFGAFQIPATIMFNGGDVVEVETTGGKLSKMVVRQPHSEHYDVIYIFLVPSGTLVTTYLNEKADHHKTLDPAPYEKDGSRWRK